jgi:hypothetical protein
MKTLQAYSDGASAPKPHPLRNPKFLLAALLLSGCAPLFVSSDGTEVRHRYQAVVSDSGDQIVVMDQEYDWSCSGSMMRCYDRETGHRFSIYRVYREDSTKRDTLVARDSGKVDFYGGQKFYWSLRRNRLIYPGLQPGATLQTLFMKDGAGEPYDLQSIPRLKEESLGGLLPSPDFRLAALRLGNWVLQPGDSVSTYKFKIFTVDLDARVMRDSVEVPFHPLDTVATGGRHLMWESDSTLLYYGLNGYPARIDFGYRIQRGVVTDTLRDLGCEGRKTSSTPWLSTGDRVEYWGGSVKTRFESLAACHGWRP